MSSSTTAAPPAGTTTESDNSPGPPVSSALYLYTFLSTLVVLIAISAAVITRSIVLRRRHRARLALTLADGSFHPAMLRRGDSSRWGGVPGLADALVPPVMYEVRIPVGGEKERDGLREVGKLLDLAPLSAKVLNPPSSAPSPEPQPRPLPLNQRPHTSRLGRYFFPQPRSSPPAVSPPASSPSPPPPALDAPTTDDGVSAPSLSFSVLVAMPDPGSKPAPPGEGAEPPYCELGVVVLPVSDGNAPSGPTNTAPATASAAPGAT